VQIVLAMSVGTFFFYHSLGNWLPEILRSGGMAVGAAGVWAAVPVAVGIAGSLIIPRLATPRWRYPIMFGLILCTGGGALLLLVAGVPALVGAVALQGIARGSLMTVLILLMMDARGLDSRHVGAAVGLFFSAAEIGGVLGPLTIGALFDGTGGFSPGIWLLATVSAVLIGLLYLHRSVERRAAVVAPG
jgi:cyanate permease